MRIGICNPGIAQPSQGTLAGINFNRQRDKTEQRCHGEQDNTEKQQLRERMQQQHSS